MFNRRHHIHSWKDINQDFAFRFISFLLLVGSLSLFCVFFFNAIHFGFYAFFFCNVVAYRFIDILRERIKKDDKTKIYKYEIEKQKERARGQRKMIFNTQQQQKTKN